MSTDVVAFIPVRVQIALLRIHIYLFGYKLVIQKKCLGTSKCTKSIQVSLARLGAGFRSA